MPFDGSGNFTRNYNWTADKLAGIKIESERMDGEFDNFATAMNQVMLRSGAIPWSGDLKMGGNKIVGLGNGTAASPAVSFLADTTTGIYLNTAGNLGLSAGGVERARVTATGLTVVGSGTMTVDGAPATGRRFAVQTSGVLRWSWGGSNVAESGGNAGTDWTLTRYDDAGNFAASAVSVARSNGTVTVAANFVVAGGAYFGTGGNYSITGDANNANLYFDSRGSPNGAYFSYTVASKKLGYISNGFEQAVFDLNGNFTIRGQFQGASLSVNGASALNGVTVITQAAANIVSVVSTTSYAALSINSAAGNPSYIMHYVGGAEAGRELWSGNSYYIQNAGGALVLLSINGVNGFMSNTGTYNNTYAGLANVGVAADGTFYRATVAAQPALGFTPIQQGGGTGQGTNKVYIGWAGTGLKAQVDTFDQGFVGLTGVSNTWTGVNIYTTDFVYNLGSAQFWRSAGGAANRFSQFIGAAGDDYYLRVFDNSSNQRDAIYIERATGFIRFPTSALSVTAAAANMFMDNPGGQIYRVTSSLRYKEDVQDYVPVGFDMLRPVTYKSRVDAGDDRYAGLIAEEVHDTGLTEFVEYDLEGRPDALRYPAMVAMLIAEMQALKARVITLEGGTPQPRTVPPPRPNPPPRPDPNPTPDPGERAQVPELELPEVRFDEPEPFVEPPPTWEPLALPPVLATPPLPPPPEPFTPLGAIPDPEAV